jgi:hypothetical protein
MIKAKPKRYNMEENKKDSPQVEDQVITITNRDGEAVEYRVSEFSAEGLRILNHVISLDSQINKLGFDLEQAQASREYFNQLMQSNLPVRD